MTEEDFETTEGETEDLYDKLMEMVGWKSTVTDDENENENLTHEKREVKTTKEFI